MIIRERVKYYFIDLIYLSQLGIPHSHLVSQSCKDFDKDAHATWSHANKDVNEDVNKDVNEDVDKDVDKDVNEDINEDVDGTRVSRDWVRTGSGTVTLFVHRFIPFFALHCLPHTRAQGP